MSFDPITFSAVNKLKASVGSLMLVPEGFTSDKFLDTGVNFNESEYPDLAAALPNSNSTDITVSAYQVPYNPSSLEAIVVKLGAVVHVCAVDSDPNTHYIIFGSGKVYISTNGETPVFYKQIITPAGISANIETSSIVNWGNFSNVVNNRIYVGGVAGGATYPVNSTYTTETYYIDLLNDFATVAVNFPRATFGWKASHTAWRAGQYITLGNPISNGTGNSAQLSICTSADGVNFSVVSTSTTLAASGVTAFAVSPTTAVFVNGSTTVNRSVDLLTWASSTTTVAVNNVVYNSTNGLFVASSGTAGAALFTSADSVAWTARAQGATACSTPIIKLLVSGADTIAVAGVATNMLQTQYSTNGTTWTRRDVQVGLYNTRHHNGSLFCTNLSNVSNNFLVSVGTYANNNQQHYQCQKLPINSYNSVLDASTIKYINYSNVTCPNLTLPVFLADGLTGCVIEYSSTIPMYVNSISGYNTSDGGQTWTPFVYKFDEILPADKKIVGLHSVKLVANDNKFFISFNTNYNTLQFQLLKSSDGINWSMSQASTFTSAPLHSSLMGFKNYLYVYALNLMVSADEGNTWQTVSNVGTYSASMQMYSTKTVAGIVDIANTSYLTTDGVNWKAVYYNITGSSQGQLATSNDRAVAMNVNSTTVMQEMKPLDIISTPISVPNNKNLVLQLADKNIVLHNTSGSALVSGDNGVSWSTVNLLNNKFTLISTLNSWCTIGATLYKLGVDSSQKKVPKVNSTVPGAKWVIRAKK